MKADTVIYHGNCTDGFTAAWVYWDVARIHYRVHPIVYHPGVYGEDPPWDLIRGKSVLVVDFSYKREVMREICSAASSVLVLDHHKSAQKELEGLAKEFDEETDCVEIYFDMNRSGARMAWDYFHEYDTMQTPDIVKWVEDVDLWRFQYPQSKAFITALRTRPYDFEHWDAAARNSLVLVAQGEPMLQYHAHLCRQFIDAGVNWRMIGGHHVPVVNCPFAFSSDVGNMLLKDYPDAPFSAVWFQRNDGMYVFSLRSEDSRTDVSQFAELFGGGGHRNASGMRMASLPW
jgi:hypothetical protein